MIKKVGLLVLLVLALNFLGLAGGIGYLVGSGKLDKDKGKQIAQILFPATQPATQPSTQPASTDPSDPMMSIDELLVKTAGMTAAEQNEFVRATFESMSAQIDRQRREVTDLRRQVDFAQAQLTRDRTALAAREKKIDDRDKSETLAAADKGFQDSLAVYDAMKAKQVKDIFSTLDEETVVRYLQAMEPRRVSSILKEFKTPAEISMAQSLLEKMRKNGVTQDATKPPEVANTPASQS